LQSCQLASLGRGKSDNLDRRLVWDACHQYTSLRSLFPNFSTTHLASLSLT
jgi:hypothetical protein